MIWRIKTLSNSARGSARLREAISHGARSSDHQGSLNLTNEELAEQIEKNPYLQLLISLEAFGYSAPFDPSMMVYFRKRLPESVANDCNEQIIRHGFAVIQSTSFQDDHDNDPGSGADNGGDQEHSTPEATGNQG